jgi:hypothetical protein
MNKTEAIIISATVALAMVPRFEAGVQSYVKAHRTEIQMAMNQLQGKPPIPFAEPDSAPQAAPQIAPKFELAVNREFSAPDRAALQAQVRAQVASMRASRVARVELAHLGPQLAGLRVLAERNAGAFQVYRLKTKKCPTPPAVPAIPTVESVNIETGSLP